jgi:hypothetical protein
MDIKFAISSHINGYTLTYPVIIESLLKSGVSPTDIYFIIGGKDINELTINNENINIVYTKQHSIDFTGLIEVLNQNIYAEYWFLLHDTVIIGQNFYNCIQSFDYSNNPPIVSLSYELSMNMGAYSWDYLQSIKDDLLTNYQNFDSSIESIQKLKTKAIIEEDKYLEKYRHKYHYTKIPRVVLESQPIYNTNTPRIIEYFYNIDLFKIKANWMRKKIYELNV